jgi:Skp family chaperone for outer membrane proteins
LGGRPQRRRAPALLLAAGFASLVACGPAVAQDAAAFLIVNQERLLTGSATGRRLLEEEEVERDKLRAEARALDAAFEAEERQLTEQRATLAPEEFRTRADAFDARVVQARREQDERATALAEEFEQRRRQFYARVAPILVMVMDRRGAKAVFDETSVLLADQSLNITDAVIAEIDASAEAAPAPPEAPAEPVPAPSPEPAAPPETSPETPPGTVAPETPEMVLPPRRQGLPGGMQQGGE